MKPATPETELPPSTRLRKAVFGGFLMIDSGNGQAQSAKVNPTQKHIPVSICCLAVYTMVSLVLPLRADIVYVAAEGRVSEINSQTGQRSVASGWNLPASGFVAADPVTGDFYTADQDDRTVYRVGRTNNVVTFVSGPGVGSGPAFSSHVYGIVVETNGNPVIVDGIEGLLAVIRVDAHTGNRVVLSAGSNSTVPAGSGAGFQSPFGIAIESTGNFLVTDISRNAVIRVDRVSGNRDLLSGDSFGDNVGLGPDMSSPRGIALRGDGAIFVIDSGGSPYFGRVIQIDPANGNRAIVFACSNNLNTSGALIYGISIATNGAIVAPFRLTVNSNPAGGSIWGIDPLTTSVATISGTDGYDPDPVRSVGTGASFFNPVGVTVDRNGLLIVSDVMDRSLFVVDPTTGNRSVLPNSRKGSGTYLYDSKGIALGTNGYIVVADDGDSTTYEQVFFHPMVNRWPLVLQVDPNTGNRSVLSAGSNTDVQRGSGSNFDRPQGVSGEKAGSFVVADSGVSNPKVVRVDPTSGNRTILSSSSHGTGTNLVAPYGIAVENNGALIVTDTGLNAVIRIDPANGNRSVLSSSSQGTGLAFLSTKGVAILEDGSLAVADANRAAIIRVDHNSGNRTVISDASHGTGQGFAGPCGVAVEDSGKLLVINSSSGALIRVDLLTGNRTVVADSASGMGPLIQPSREFLTIAPPIRLTTPLRLGNGTVQFTLLSPVGRHCLVEWSTNFTTWTLLINLTSTSATNIVLDAGAVSQNARFYRAWIAQ